MNAIPIIGWALSLLFAISTAVPFWFIWNRLAPTYFYWLPTVYKYLPFWHCVGLFIVVSILKSLLLPSINNSNSCK